MRLRRADGRAILTYKGAARFEAGAKVREERETEVSDPEETVAILAGLGLSPRFRYDKRREDWTCEGATVALDTTPIGRFVEIEGDPPTIRRVVALLGLDASESVPYSYAELYARRRKDEPSLPPDMVFGSVSRHAGDPACAGRGVRFRPVTERIPKPLLPFLNVPLAVAHLRRLHEAGIREVAVNLHHLGDQVERQLREQSAELPHLRFFPEPQILGTAGALRNAAEFLGQDDFLVVNSDAAIDVDFDSLLARHRTSGRAATLLVTENRDPEHYTPLQAEGDRITAFGVHGPGALLYTGICVLSPRLLPRIPPGETALVAHLWQPILDEGREELGFVLHHGPHADLGRPGDFLRASLEALARGGPFPKGGGVFDAGRARPRPPAARRVRRFRERPRPRRGRRRRGDPPFGGLGRRFAGSARAPDGLPRGSRPRSRRSPL